MVSEGRAIDVDLLAYAPRLGARGHRQMSLRLSEPFGMRSVGIGRLLTLCQRAAGCID